MEIVLHIRHELRLLRFHGSGYACARLVALMVLAVCLGFAWMSLLQARELFFGPQPLALRGGLQGAQTSMLLQHTLLAAIVAGLGWLAYGLWLLDERAWWIALALSAPLLAANPSALPASVGLPMFLFWLLLACSCRTFRAYTTRQ